MLKKMKGGGVIQPRPDVISVIRGFLGGTLGILMLLIVTYWGGTPSIMAPFGATCVLLFAVPNAPLSQPRSVIGGHFISALVGLLFINIFGDGMIFIALAVGVSVALMQILRVVHAPAGANPILIFLSGIHDYTFLLTPVLSGAVVLVLIALVVNNIGSRSIWPCYWLGRPVIKNKTINSKER
ncbi:HPP family protein [Orbus wheelerorum]|uniref:HPP family protein n=1 Tax=Orbus wheelerorum TaxID=3074111 RepID=UPI00370DDB63